MPSPHTNRWVRIDDMVCRAQEARTMKVARVLATSRPSEVQISDSTTMLVRPLWMTLASAMQSS